MDRTEKASREYADHIQARYPGNHSAWGIAYDAHRVGMQSMVCINQYDNITEKEVKQIENFLRKRYTVKGIAKAMGYEYSLVSQIVKDFMKKQVQQ